MFGALFLTLATLFGYKAIDTMIIDYGIRWQGLIYFTLVCLVLWAIFTKKIRF